MLKIQGRDFYSCLTGVQLKLVRTYKGEIKRTQTGKVSVFPVSFITVGFDLQFLGLRDEIKLIQQVLLSSDLVEMILTYDGVTIKGAFSCTANDYTEVRDKGERRMTLNVSVVSDGTNITDGSGALFSVKYGETTLVSNCSFGKVYTVGATYKLNGSLLPGGKLLVLGNTQVTT